VRGLSANGALDRLWTVTEELRRGVADTTVVSGTITLDQDALVYGASGVVNNLMGLTDPETIIERRRANFELLHARLRHLSALKLETLPPGACPLFYPIIVEDKPSFRAALAARGIGSVNLWSQPHAACPGEVTAQTARWRRTILELPIHQQLSTEDIERIAREVLSLMPSRIAPAQPTAVEPEALEPGDAMPLPAPSTV